jgi:hypothetical protein
MNTKLKQFLEAIQYKITGGRDYNWHWYGTNARFIESDSSFNNKYFCAVIFDAKNQTVYEVEVHDFNNERRYRWINPDFEFLMVEESNNRKINKDVAYGGVGFTDVVYEDLIEKMTAIVNGDEYDTRVIVPVDFDDATFMFIAKAAHIEDITFNKFVEKALLEQIAKMKEYYALYEMCKW